MDRTQSRSNVRDDSQGDRPFGHPILHDLSPDFSWSVTVELREEEALFIQEQMATHRSGSLLAFLANHPPKTLDVSFWDLPVIETANTLVRTAVELARRFLLFVESMPLVYIFVLAEQQTELTEISDTTATQVEEYQHRLEHRISQVSDEEYSFKPSDLWTFLYLGCPITCDKARRSSALVSNH